MLSPSIACSISSKNIHIIMMVGYYDGRVSLVEQNSSKNNTCIKVHMIMMPSVEQNSSKNNYTYMMI